MATKKTIDVGAAIQQRARTITQRAAFALLAAPAMRESAIASRDRGLLKLVMGCWRRLSDTLSNDTLKRQNLREWQAAVSRATRELELLIPHRKVQPAVDAATAGSKVRPCYERDHLFLKWYETDGALTYRSNAKIRDKWNGMTKQDRGVHCSRNTNNVSIEAVITAIKSAKKERGKNKST